jgi:hypothetical protein
MNILNQPIAMSHQIHTYTELRQQIHDDLRIQHPEWIERTGECPECDEHEARLRGLLDALARSESNTESGQRVLVDKTTPVRHESS